MAHLIGMSTMLPEYCVTATDTKAYLSGILCPDAATRFSRMVDVSRNRTRYAVLPLEELARIGTFEARNEAYRRNAVALGESVAKEALLLAEVDRDAVDAVICVSSTGYMMPSLEVHLINRLQLKPTCRRFPIMQLGCAGGVAGIGLATELIGAAASRNVLVVSVEFPSLSLPVAEPSVTDVVSSTQFGDGAAATLWSGQRQALGLEVLATEASLFPETVDRDGLQLTGTGFRLMRQRGLARLVRSHLRAKVGSFLDSRGLRFEDISFWVVHPRGPQILEAVSEALQLDDQALAASWAVWERYGNMISSSVFFVLCELQQSVPPRDGDFGVMLALGAGVTCEMVLLRAHG